MWDHYLHENNLENGDVASDHYHHFEEDIKMMKDGGQNAYRFSLSWPRIIKNRAGDISPKGIEFYNKLINCCLKNDITPLCHFTLGSATVVGGWFNLDTNVLLPS
ncbi:family 1 glycosylhydrolase [Lactobacillus kimbladii]|uniref:family 1 glycosylhydrolase n=1 Tax=Lactobacillus kimbladii TaxID=1218506 RepID=UPI0021C5A12E|nr:family 1 glycosylhydrolase [Lactobacillus kimbladii]